jgi:hypothetical protein
MIKLVVRKYAIVGSLISLIIISTFACSSQDEEFQSLRTLDDARTSYADQIQEDPPSSNNFLESDPFGFDNSRNIQIAADRFYSSQAAAIDSSYRAATAQIELAASSCYERLMRANVARPGNICDFSYQLQELERMVDMDYNSLWNQVRTFENEVSRLDWGSSSFDVQYRLENELNRIGGMSLVDPYRYENEMQQDQWFKEEQIYRAESYCNDVSSGILYSGISPVECENDDPFGINKSYNSGFGLDDQDCQFWDFNCEQSDPFGQQSDPFGQQLDPFGQQSDPFGQQLDPFGQQSDPFGQQLDPFGQQSDPFGR